jgi:hypothetical protein
MKRLSTKGVTDEMPNHCTTRFNLMDYIKQVDYKINRASQSRCLNSWERVSFSYGDEKKFPAKAQRKAAKVLSAAVP